MITIGFLELNSISKGILAADEMIKAADIALIAARPSCPGKYQILITGEVSSVEAALDAGQAASSSNVIDALSCLGSIRRSLKPSICLLPRSGFVH